MSNIAYIALYRKYRPKIFSQVVGQEHITKTLKNQVKDNKVAHAYLFSGPRGTGKTSIAKILARAVNCEQNEDGDPCNTCENCLGIIDESIKDVIEIDAASNNSVDNIRNIRDEIIYTPAKAKFKVYIIDEVHMLSTGAFNALLKTLEEPPSHVMFILATTEPHKLLPTIISRCQKFDFNRILASDIFNKLKEITKNAQINIEDNALNLIASLSDGALRDALSMLDQSISSGKEKITHQQVLDMIGIVDSDVLFEMSDSIKQKNTSRGIKIVNDVFYNGKDLSNFIENLIWHYRNLLMAKVSKDLGNIVDLSQENIEKLKKSVDEYNQQEIIDIIKILSDTLYESKKSAAPKVLLETAVINLCNVSQGYNNFDLIERIEKLESAVKDGKIVKDDIQKEQTNLKEEIKQEVEEQEIEQKDEEKEENIQNAECSEEEYEQIAVKEKLSKEVSINWNNILEDMKKKGFTPLKIQCINEIIIKPFSESTVLGYIEYTQNIYPKILEEKYLLDELKDSISKILDKQVNIKIKSKKINEEKESEIDKFKDLVYKKGFQCLLNEI